MNNDNKKHCCFPRNCYIVGPTGPTGPQGAATITVGTTTTGLPGTNASVTNSGTLENPILDFVIPAGATGATAIYLKWHKKILEYLFLYF